MGPQPHTYGRGRFFRGRARGPFFAAGRYNGPGGPLLQGSEEPRRGPAPTARARNLRRGRLNGPIKKAAPHAWRRRTQPRPYVRAITAPHPPGGDDPLAAVYVWGWGPSYTAPHPPPGGDDPPPPLYVRGWAPGYAAPPYTPGGDEPPTAPIC
eukprot:gene18023-biopygen18936